MTKTFKTQTTPEVDINTTKPKSLIDFGWSPYYQSQLTLEDLDAYTPARVMAAHRGALDVAAPDLEMRVSLPPADDTDDGSHTVGDWLLIDQETQTIARRLERVSMFKRRAPGSDQRIQLIAANVDTLFIVSSCNADFNLARLERYLVLARDADVVPIIVLTKADTCDDSSIYVSQALGLMPGLLAEALDARSSEDADRLLPWCGVGQTVAIVGSSGVGKSTLVNTLSGTDDQETQSIREDDAKGRHTTSRRSLHHLPAGGWLLDTPGMRELQMTDVEDGLADVFADIIALTSDCKFSDCAHNGEPGCAVEQALKGGTLELARLTRYRKLAAEDARNSASLAERRARDKSLGKMYRGSQKQKAQRRKTP